MSYEPNIWCGNCGGRCPFRAPYCPANCNEPLQFCTKCNNHGHMPMHCQKWHDLHGAYMRNETWNLGRESMPAQGWGPSSPWPWSSDGPNTASGGFAAHGTNTSSPSGFNNPGPRVPLVEQPDENQTRSKTSSRKNSRYSSDDDGGEEKKKSMHSDIRFGEWLATTRANARFENWSFAGGVWSDKQKIYIQNWVSDPQNLGRQSCNEEIMAEFYKTLEEARSSGDHSTVNKMLLGSEYGKPNFWSRRPLLSRQTQDVAPLTPPNEAISQVLRILKANPADASDVLGFGAVPLPFLNAYGGMQATRPVPQGPNGETWLKQWRKLCAKLNFAVFPYNADMGFANTPENEKRIQMALQLLNAAKTRLQTYAQTKADESEEIEYRISNIDLGVGGEREEVRHKLHVGRFGRDAQLYDEAMERQAGFARS